MTNDKRGRAPHRALPLCAIAALGLALSGCGGSQAGTSAATSAAAQSAPAAQSVAAAPAPASTPSPTPAQGTATPPSSSTGSTSTTTSGSGSIPPPPTATTGNVTLNWVPPTENVDGTPLSNLAGYDIHYGTTSGQYTQAITVNNPGIATYVVSNLNPGTYYFSVAAVNSQGTESPLSSEVSTTVN